MNVDQQLSSTSNYEEKEEPIHILGIITDDVGAPRLDGTRGSALYKVPFQLSKTPSQLWKELFIQEWNGNFFSNMHRPGIALVEGARIILNGTTIEEVRDYHGRSLKICVDEANRLEEQIISEDKRQKEQRERIIQQHNAKVSAIVKEIEF